MFELSKKIEELFLFRSCAMDITDNKYSYLQLFILFMQLIVRQKNEKRNYLFFRTICFAYMIKI